LKKKLSILIYSLAGGGAERVVSVLLDGLKDQYEITLVLMRDKIDYEIPKEIKIHFIENSNPDEKGIFKLLKLPYLGWEYKNFCRKNNIDISLAFTNRPVYIVMFAKIFGLKIKSIISERTTPSKIYASHSLQSSINKFLIKWLYPKSDKIIANSQGNKRDLIQNFGINKNAIVTIHNPFDIEKIEQQSQEYIDDFNFDRFTFVSVGRVDAGKNYELLIEAFKELNFENTQLLILGEGALKKELESLVKEYKLDERVYFMGFRENPYRYMAKSDCFVFSSNYEGFPNVLVEALVCNLAVISTDCRSGPREILAPGTDAGFQLEEGIEESEYGVLTPVNDVQSMKKAMKLMYEDEKVRQKYIGLNKKRIGEFNKYNISDEYKKWL
jgi:N-acetylgalactosamine-N,N'-diacetylbacillosaminyl-diphospho-undecaprenol 4-alpha-N-acetylgalactosaminyltransferase